MSKCVTKHKNILNIDRCYLVKNLAAKTFTIYYEMVLADNTVEALIKTDFFKNSIPKTKKLV